MRWLSYVRPDEMFTAYNATGVAGAVEDTYDADWLVDGRPGFPAMAPSGTITWTVTGPAKEVGIVAACNHNIESGIIPVVGGDVVGNMGAVLPSSNQIFRNPFLLPDNPVMGVDSLSITVTANPRPVTIGELVAGKLREMERPVLPGGFRRFVPKNEEPGSLYSSLNPYDYGIKKRILEVESTCTAQGIEDLELWYDSTRDRSRLTLVVPDPLKNDCMLAKFTKFEYSKQGPQYYRVSMSFEDELCRW